jgi:hypothetical protein
LPPYAALIRGLTDGTTGGFEAMTTEQRGFNMLEMSATFSDLPRSKKLTGKIEDYYVTDFKKFMAKNQKAFQKKTIVFCDDMKKLNLKPLDDKTKKKEERVKYLILDDALKDYATDLVRNLKPPLLVFANRDYSVGFSFGDVNVISTGISRRTIVVDDKGNEKVVGDGAGNDRGVNDIADILQQRGRAARDPSDEGIHGALIPAAGKFKLDSDYMGKTVESYLKKKLASGAKDANLKKVIALAKVERRTTPLSKEKGNLYLRQILVKSMKECLDNPSSLFNLLPSEAGKREAGEFIFQNKLMKYFDEGQLKDMLIKATEEAITNFSKGYK